MSFSPVLDSALITAVAFTFRDERRVHAAKDRSYDSIVNEILNENLIFTCCLRFVLIRGRCVNRGNRKSTTPMGADRKSQRHESGRFNERRRASARNSLRINNSELLERVLYIQQDSYSKGWRVGGRSASAASPLMFSAISDNGGLWRV